MEAQALVSLLSAAGLLASAALLLAAPAGARADGTPVVGGGSFNTAPLLAEGRYSDSVAAGETVYWKVRLAKGQVLEVTATVDTSAIQDDVSKPDYRSGLALLDYHLDIHSPLREPLGQNYPDASVRLEGDRGAGSVTGTARGPRILGFEQILASDFSLDKFPAPGASFVSLSAADSDSQPAEIPAELPVDFEIEIVGAPQPSSPHFAHSLPGPPPEEPPASPDPIGSAPESASEDDATITTGLVALLALLGGALLGALAAVVLGTGRGAAINDA